MQSPHGIKFSAHRPTIMGRNGMVASGHPLASQAGVKIMMQGGNAVDAAIATAAALGVVEPYNSGMGGDGFLLIYCARDNQVRAVNGTGAAPYGARRELFLDSGIPKKGILSVSVPGIVDAWCIAHEKYGALTLEQVLDPAIDLAENGFPVSHKLAGELRGEHRLFSSDPLTRAVFTKNGTSLGPGDILVQEDLAESYRKLASGGRDRFYKGDIARELLRFSEGCNGLLQKKDLADHQSHFDEPIHTTYHGYKVFESPPNSSGHVLLQELNIVEQFELPASGCNTAQSIHLMVEAKKLAFADREQYVADPRWVDIPLEGLLSKAYAAERASGINPDRAATDVGPGGPEHCSDTTCFCVVDGQGNAVCQLQSLQQGFGSSLIAGKTGILLNNRMTYWHLDQDHVNVLQPGKRVRHTMNPVIVTSGDKLFLTCGTPGADTQVQTNLQLITHMIDFGMNAQEAVEAPRWRSLQNPMESTVPHTCEDTLQLEDRFPEAVRQCLADKGHSIDLVGDWGGPGSAMAIVVDPDTGALMGGADPRRDGYAVGW